MNEHFSQGIVPQRGSLSVESSESTWGSEEGQECPTLNPRAEPQGTPDQPRRPGVGIVSRGESLEWALTFLFSGAYRCWLSPDHGDGSRCLTFLSPLFPSWASTDACSPKNWGDCEPSPAYSSKLALIPSLREDPLTSFSCFLGFLSLRVLPEV